jgi:hypothetical protein
MESMRVIKSRNLCQITGAGFTCDEALRLQDISRFLHHLDEAECNYGLTHRQESRQITLENEATKICKAHNLVAYHQGDPRGWSLYIVKTNLDDYSQGIAVCPHLS